MNRIKTLLTTTIITLASFGFVNAQDVNAAIEAYNAGATAAQEENYVAAIEKLTNAMELASALGEEGASVVSDCKNLIPTLYLRQGKELAAAKNNTEALAVLAKASETATAYGDTNGVAAEAKEVCGKVYMAIANGAFNDKNFEEAIANYAQVLAIDPENGAAYLRSGLALLNTGKEEEAIATLEKAKAFGQEAAAAKQLGTFYLKKAVSAQKTKAWQNVYDNAKLSIAQNDAAQANKLLGLAAIELKKFDEALGAWTKVMESNPSAKDINTTYYRMAVSYEGLGQKGNACSYYKKLLSDPNFKSVAEYKIKTELKCE